MTRDPVLGEVYRLFEVACGRGNEKALRLAKRLQETFTSDEWDELLLEHADQIRAWAAAA